MRNQMVEVLEGMLKNVRELSEIKGAILQDARQSFKQWQVSNDKNDLDQYVILQDKRGEIQNAISNLENAIRFLSDAITK